MGLRGGTLVNRKFITDHLETAEAYKAFVQDYLDYGQSPDGMSYLDEL